MDYYSYNDYRSYLAHHGVVGMHWGIRRYQPYGSGGYNRIGGKKGVEKISKKNDSNTRLYKLETKRAVSVMASEKAREAAITRIRKQPIDEKSGLPLKTEKWTPIQDQKEVNPGYSPLLPGTNNNCGLCTATYELRRRGFDVCAGLADRFPDGVDEQRLSNWFGIDYSGSKRWSIYEPRIPYSPVNQLKASKGMNHALAKYAVKELKKEKEGSRGVIGVQWSKYSGHWVNYEINNGKIIIRDCQTGETYNEKDAASKFLNHCCSIEICRVDDLQIDYKKIKEVVA